MARGFLRTTGRDVLFSHWPVDPGTLRSLVPEALSIDTFEGEGWITALAIRQVSAGVRGVPVERSGPRLVVRTYVRRGEKSGVFFLGIDASDRLGALIGRRALGLPISPARIETEGRPDPFEFYSRRRRFGGPSARFRARYRPTGRSFRAEPGSLEAFLVERSRFFLTDDDRSAAARFREESLGVDGRLRASEIDRTAWWLREASATVEVDGYFRAIGLDAPSAEPHCLYSQGFRIDTGVPRAIDPEDGS
jgi:uncharacterized protein YqjF (DUF2071 family)